MKTLLRIWALIAVIVWAGVCPATDLEVQTGFQYDGWKDSEKNKGYQIHVPLRAAAQIKDFSFSVLGGYAYTYYDPKVGESRSLSHTLDTKVNFSYEILDKLPFDLLLGLDINLPTGKTPLQQKDLVLIMDPDLASITKLGEGYNLNPTISVAKEWGEWAAGLGIGYVWRGEYDFTTHLRNYDPGDIFTTTAEIRYDFAPRWTGRLFGQYARYGKDQVDNQNYYKEGDFYLLGLGVRHAQKSWDAAFTLRYIFRGKSDFLAQTGQLVTPDNNIHGDEWIGDLALRYFVSDKITLWSKLTGLWIENNDFPSNNSFYIGRRGKVSLELGGKVAFARYLEAALMVRGFSMHDEEAQFPESRGERSYQGFSIGFNLGARF